MEFIQPTEQASNSNRLSSVAMEFNGTIIENELEGYRTLKVSGRETISNELVVESVHEGGITLDNHLPSRSIQVTYEMKAETNELFQEQYKALRKFLPTEEEVPIKFADESTTVYFGRLSTIEVPADDRNNVVSTFVIHCDSPYKFGDLVATSGVVSIDTFYKTYPERIVLSVPTTRNNIEIQNGTERITATGTFNAGSEVVVKFEKEEVTMSVNGVEATYMLDLQSDLENFELRQGQTVTSPHGDITLEMRERWL